MSKVYIEKEAAIRNICKGCGLFDTDNCICTGSVRCDEYDAILDTPSANVKPVVMGEWGKPIWGRDSLDQPIIIGSECSICHKVSEIPTRFCPHCGAEMEGQHE